MYGTANAKKSAHCDLPFSFGKSYAPRLKKYVLNKFVDLYNSKPDTNGYIPIDSKKLEDVSEYDCKYLHYEGYLRPTLNGYELSEEYIKEITQNSMEL